MGKPKLGTEVRIVKSIRIEPLVFEKIKDIYGSLANFINEKVKRDKKLK